jgi:putative ABC transport system permease protein
MIYTFSQISGVRAKFQKATDLTGPGRMDISPKRGYVSKGLSRGLTWQDAQRIRETIPGLYMVYPFNERHSVRMRFLNFKNDNMVVRGVTPDWRLRDWAYTLRGRFLNSRDEAATARVCVLKQPGGWVEKPFWASYFPEQAIEKVLKRRDLLGRQVLLEDHLFTVVGIIMGPPRDKDPRWFNRDWDGGSIGGTVFVPSTTFRQFLTRTWGSQNPDAVDAIQVDTGNEATAASCKRRIETLLETRHRGEIDFEVKDYRDLIQGALGQVREYAVGIAVIGIVAILAGGIGIMNVTLATIFSRVREIGIRRALGATRRDIIAQFLVEATLLGTLGGAVGAGLGIAAVTYLAPEPDWMGPILLIHILSAMGIAAAVAFSFALLPAYQASRLDPIESLHYE